MCYTKDLVAILSSMVSVMAWSERDGASALMRDIELIRHYS